MARKPPNVAWLGYTAEQVELLDFLDLLGNNGWARNGQTEEPIPRVLSDCEQAGLCLARIKEAMASVGYSNGALHQLDRWESKRTTGTFDR
jgi:hypothetical protein